ncbi:MAG: SusD/RagB family nutrient-binding outer membrane lipoprotein [Chitinophagaceae bacterium]|nr:SusD/RagB family nutrient-binding outer membrane lipoprotein [Chitinophagaceae bacterium]
MKANKISICTVLWLVSAATFFMQACTKDYKEINTDKTAVATVGDAELPFLFSGAIESIPWGNQVAENLFAAQYAQYFACNATYFPTDRYTIVSDYVLYNFDPMYARVAPQLQVILERKDPGSAEAALANIWWVYAFQRVTDYWGPIPYFSIGEGGRAVPYDAQDKIYDDFLKRLAGATDILKDKRSETPFGKYDLIYNGNVDKWIKFANTLRLRIALRISNVDPARAKTEAEAAYAGGVLTTSPGDDTYAPKNTLDQNPLSRMSDWNEFRMSATMASVLKGYNDPRISVYFIPAKNTGTYEGLRNGLSESQLGDPRNKPDANSHVGPRWSSPAYGGIASYLSTPAKVMCAAEAWFLRAEGALLGWNMGGTAKELYENGIKNSMLQWDITDETVVQDYINSTAVPVAPGDYLNSPAVTNIPVKFGTDVSVQQEQIATQKWLALFPDAMEAWADYRRGHYNKLYPVVNSDNPDLTDPATQWIRRIPFLITEKQSNAEEVAKAEKLLNGPDKITTALWWDIH